MLKSIRRLLLAAVFIGGVAHAVEHVYVGELGPNHALIAWGSTDGDDTIGRNSQSMGTAEVRVEGRAPVSAGGKNWALVDGLDPDKSYKYSVWVGGRRIGGDLAFRTWPAAATRLAFLVIGDFGRGNHDQRMVARAMTKTLDSEGEPIRFVLTTGDNIYRANPIFGGRGGDKDKHWEETFFQPYADLLAGVPFYATLGNHDGNETEKDGDLAAYLDNFFFPGEKPASSNGGRYYRFQFGGLAEFFALDTTSSAPTRPQRKANYKENEAQFQWLKEKLTASTARWQIPYFHHPLYSAGPNHKWQRGVTSTDNKDSLSHFADLFKARKVPVAFSGHEHNLQYTRREATDDVRYVLTGGGAEADACPSALPAAIEGCIAVPHFLRVDIDGGTMTIRALTFSESGGSFTGVVPVKIGQTPVEIKVVLPPGP